MIIYTDFEMTFFRSLFEELCQSIFDRAFDPVTDVMKDSGMTKEKINEVVLVGGSTRFPKIQAMLSEFFSGKTLNKSIHPDEAVA
jgi:heat shock protein 1/8